MTGRVRKTFAGRNELCARIGLRPPARWHAWFALFRHGRKPWFCARLRFALTYQVVFGGSASLVCAPSPIGGPVSGLLRTVHLCTATIETCACLVGAPSPNGGPASGPPSARPQRYADLRRLRARRVGPVIGPSLARPAHAKQHERIGAKLTRPGAAVGPIRVLWLPRVRLPPGPRVGMLQHLRIFLEVS